MRKNLNSSVTINVVAKYCGLSTATISRAINDPEKLRPETLQLVREAFAKLGYTHNILAASLSRSSSNLIGVMVGNIRENTYLYTLERIQEIAARHQYDVMVAISDFDDAKEYSILRNFLRYRTNAVIVIGPGHHCHEHIRTVLGKSAPHLIMWDVYDDADINYIGCDDYELMHNAVNFLAAAGHKRIGLGMSIHSRIRRAMRRIQGFKKSMNTRGSGYVPSIVLLNDAIRRELSPFLHGKEIMEKFLAQEIPPTGILFPTGNMAAGGISAMRERGLRCPEDISILCLANDDMARNFYPSITSMQNHQEEAATYLSEYIDSLASGSVSELHIKLPSNVLARQTCAPLKMNYARMEHKECQTHSVPD